jgi:PncC family amidohydrolase
MYTVNIVMKSRDLDIIKNMRDVMTSTGLTVSVAESCTGGLLSHYLTLLPGSSAFFKAGIITYSTSSKEDLLHIPRKALSRYGVVSRETAILMAERARAVTKANFSMAITGNIGPAVIENSALGLIYVAVNGSFGSECRELRLKGNRDENKNDAAISAIELLLEVIKEK